MSSTRRNCLKPAPRGPSRFSSGTRQSRERQRPRVGRVPAHLAVRLALLVAGRAVGDEQVGDLVVAGAGGDHDHAGDVGAGVGDELLGAVDHPLAVLEPRARADVAGVRARLRLGQPERAELAPRGQLRQPVALLLLGAEQVDRLRAERGVRAHRDRHRGVDARELLDRDRVGERVARRRRRTPRGTGCPSAPARRAWRRSRTGTASRGRAPRRPARPPARRSRARCGGSARGRGRGRSPWPTILTRLLDFAPHDRARGAGRSLRAGAVAGGVNAVVGSGSLITFPTLLAVGYSPVTANVSNSVGLVPGGVSGSVRLPARAARPVAALRDPRGRHHARGAARRHPAARAAGRGVRRGRPGADPARGRADGAAAVAEAPRGRRATCRPASRRRSPSGSTAATSAPPRGSS